MLALLSVECRGHHQGRCQVLTHSVTGNSLYLGGEGGDLSPFLYSLYKQGYGQCFRNILVAEQMNTCRAKLN